MSTTRFTRKLPKPKPRREDFEWNFEALSDISTWRSEALRGHREGIDGCGRFGISCPKCYLPIAPSGARPKDTCQCGHDMKPGDIATEAMQVLGFDQAGFNGASWSSQVKVV